jgi:DNA-directed RNA polymerase subunit E'/Rpb7
MSEVSPSVAGFQCITFRPFKGEVLDCGVSSVNKVSLRGVSTTIARRSCCLTCCRLCKAKFADRNMSSRHVDSCWLCCVAG